MDRMKSNVGYSYTVMMTEFTRTRPKLKLFVINLTIIFLVLHLQGM